MRILYVMEGVTNCALCVPVDSGLGKELYLSQVKKNYIIVCYERSQIKEYIWLEHIPGISFENFK